MCGGCVGGGGQPKLKLNQEMEVKEKRVESLMQRDAHAKVRVSYQNPELRKIYHEFLEEPLSEKAIELLHTIFEDRSMS